MWRNFQFPHNCHTWKAEISPHDNFFSTNIIRDIRDKYQVCFAALVFVRHCPWSFKKAATMSRRCDNQSGKKRGRTPRICDISHVRLQPCSVVIISTTWCCLTDQKGVKTSIRAVALSVRPWGHHVAMRRQCLETEGIPSGAQHFPWRKRTSLWTPWCTIVFLLFQKKDFDSSLVCRLNQSFVMLPQFLCPMHQVSRVAQQFLTESDFKILLWSTHCRCYLY